MRIRGDIESVNLSTGEKHRRVTGDGESRLEIEDATNPVVAPEHVPDLTEKDAAPTTIASQPAGEPQAPQPPSTERQGALTFEAFSRINRQRCEAESGFNHQLASWSTSDWFLAILGELGEAANVAKKLNRYRDGIRGNKVSEEELRNKLRQELGDTFVYLDLIAQALGFYIGDAATEVFNSKSDELNCPIRIEAASTNQPSVSDLILACEVGVLSRLTAREPHSEAWKVQKDIVRDAFVTTRKHFSVGTSQIAQGAQDSTARDLSDALMFLRMFISRKNMAGVDCLKPKVLDWMKRKSYEPSILRVGDAESKPDSGNLIAHGAQVCEKQFHMYTWHRVHFIAAVQASSVAEARALLLEEIGSSGDGSCPEREAAVEWISRQNPHVFHRANAEFALTYSGELREQEVYAEIWKKRAEEAEAKLAQAVAEEREACAKIADGELYNPTDGWPYSSNRADYITRAIRARSGGASGEGGKS
jgi:NTP pyrophosphatase (non-canonical NTP hydrolase)